MTQDKYTGCLNLGLSGKYTLSQDLLRLGRADRMCVAVYKQAKCLQEKRQIRVQVQLHSTVLLGAPKGQAHVPVIQEGTRKSELTQVGLFKKKLTEAELDNYSQEHKDPSPLKIFHGLLRVHLTQPRLRARKT